MGNVRNPITEADMPRHIRCRNTTQMRSQSGAGAGVGSLQGRIYRPRIQLTMQRILSQEI